MLRRYSGKDRRERRVAWFRRDIEGFCRYYLGHAFGAPFADVHRRLLTLEGSCVEEVFRGAGKSTCISAVLIHALLYGWKRFVLIASWTIDQSTEFSRRIREELEHNERIIEDFGPQVGLVWRESHFVTRFGRTLKAAGVNKGVRGLISAYDRPDLLVIDDVEDDERVNTVEQRDKLYKRVTTAFLNLGASVGNNPLWTWVIGTPLHQDCLLRRLKHDGWRYNQTPATLDGQPEGDPTWPSFDKEAIAERIRTIGSKAARQELFLQPLDDGEAAFVLDWFRYYADDMHARDGWDHYIYVDPAIGQKKTSDYFVATVVAAAPSHPEIRVVEQYRGKLSFAQQIRKLYLLWDQYRPIQIGIEANAYQDSLRQQLVEHSRRTGQYMPLVPVFSSRAKALRIRDSSPFVEFGEVTFHPSQHDVIQHLCDWPSVAHDDIEDSFAGAIKMVRRTGRLMVA